MTRRLATIVFACALAALVLPEAASACAVCLAGQGGGTGRAFAIGSLFLSVIPLAVIGGGVWWLRRRARALQAVSPPASQPVPPRA